jgi:hypothetical protein
MEQERSGPIEFPTFVVALLLLAVPLAFYWRHDLFFMWDDWTELDLMAHNSFWKYLAMPDGEIFFPFFHLIFYSLVKISGEHYSILVLVNCLGIGLISFLLYLFLKRHFPPMLSLAMSLLYAGTTVHQAIGWNAFYLSYILSLGFFLLALLLTDRYMRSSTVILLLSIGFCAFLSIHSHNYTLLALVALPFYAALMGDSRSLRKCLPLVGVIAIVLVVFFGEYLTFVGLKGLTFYNHVVLSSFPGQAFFSHWFFGAFLAPLSFLFWGHNQSPGWAFFFGLLVWSGIIAVICWLGGLRERRLGLFAVLVNALPFLAVSLGRHQISINQALMVRYVFFTLLGTLLLAGTAWNILSARFARGIGHRLIPLVLIIVMVSGQILSIPVWQRGYLHLSRKAFECYQEPELLTKGDNLWLTPHHPLKQCQIEDIRQFLKGSEPSEVNRLARGAH